MAWKIKKRGKGYQDRRFDKKLEDLTQLEINKLNEALKNTWFIEEKPKKKKENEDKKSV